MRKLILLNIEGFSHLFRFGIVSLEPSKTVPLCRSKNQQQIWGGMRQEVPGSLRALGTRVPRRKRKTLWHFVRSDREPGIASFWKAFHWHLFFLNSPQIYTHKPKSNSHSLVPNHTILGILFPIGYWSLCLAWFALTLQFSDQIFPAQVSLAVPGVMFGVYLH